MTVNQKHYEDMKRSKSITLYSKQKILMREALELQKQIDTVVIQFAFDKEYMERRKLELMDLYAAALSDLIRISSQMAHLRGSELEKHLKKNI
jgi:hypothetical protein